MEQIKVTDDLLGGLRVLMKELAASYDKNRSDADVNNACVKLLHRLYEKCEMATKRQVMKELVAEFKALKLPVQGDDTDDSATEVVDII